MKNYTPVQYRLGEGKQNAQQIQQIHPNFMLDECENLIQINNIENQKAKAKAEAEAIDNAIAQIRANREKAKKDRNNFFTLIYE